MMMDPTVFIIIALEFVTKIKLIEKKTCVVCQQVQRKIGTFQFELSFFNERFITRAITFRKIFNQFFLFLTKV